MHINEIITLSLEISDLRKDLKKKERALKRIVTTTTSTSKKGKNPPEKNAAPLNSFWNVDEARTVVPTERAARPRRTHLDRCLGFLEESGDWCHRSLIAQFLDLTMARTSGLLCSLKKEGQVHNDGRGHWHYGRGDRKIDKIPRG